MDRLMLGTVCLCTLSVVNLKMLGMILAEGNMKALHRCIANNWLIIEDSCERDILQKYSERARKATIFYVVLLLAPAVFGAALPLIPKFLDFVWPLKDPRPNIYISAGELFFDRETHFLLGFVLEYIGIMLLTLVLITVDTMYFVYVEHCCALFAIIRFRLLELRPVTQKRSSETEGIDSYEWLCRTIQLHNKALKCTSLLNDSYTLSFLFLFFVGLLFIPCGSCAIIANLHNPLHLIPYVILLVNGLAHGFCMTYPGQRVIDHQRSLLDAAYCNEWYTLPLRTRKLLLIVMMRCSEPAVLTAGNIFPVNFTVYFQIVKTSASYITVASSFR